MTNPMSLVAWLADGYPAGCRICGGNVSHLIYICGGKVSVKSWTVGIGTCTQTTRALILTSSKD